MDTDFIKQIPKIELHAHLNGSLMTESILELGEEIYGANTENFKELKKNLISFTAACVLDDCFKKFKLVHELTATKNGLIKATQMVIRDFSRDNVIYLELRTTPKCNETITKQDYLEIVLEAIQNSHEVKNEEIIVKLLPSIDRSKSIDEALETIQTVIKMREQSAEYAKLLIGIDLSGNPKSNTFENFKFILEKARQNNLKLTLHCAEIDNTKEVKEMLGFSMDRCGHGTFLSDAQFTELKKRQIAIECCLTSNVLCSTVSSFEDHHFKRIFQHGNCEEWNENVVLCTDDSGVFDTSLSQELELAKKYFQLKKEDIVRLQLNAIKHSFCSDVEKNDLNKKISKFCADQKLKI